MKNIIDVRDRYSLLDIEHSVRMLHKLFVICRLGYVT